MKTKRFVAVLMLIVLCLGIVSCTGKNGSEETKRTEATEETEYDPCSRFKSYVETLVNLRCRVNYKDVMVANTTLYDVSASGNVYTGKGRVTIRDSYGDTYVAKVTAVFMFYEETRTFSEISLDIETPVKQ